MVAPHVQQHIISVMESGKPSSGAGKFTAHGSVKPDVFMFTELKEKSANAAFSTSDFSDLRRRRKRLVL